MCKGNWEFKARTHIPLGPYDGTESRDTTSSRRYTRTSKSPTDRAQSQSQKFASVFRYNK